MKKLRYIFAYLLMLSINNSYSKLVKYNLDIDVKTVNFTGKQRKAIAVDDKIPGPVIEATVGDILEVTFNNKMNEETSIHWHGVILPNDQDGVPYLTTQPIAPHSSFTYKYKITHHGTYWYHSHTGLQEQRGLYGSLVFHPKFGDRIKSDRDYIVVLSDWTNENPNQVFANLKKDGDYYALKKDTVQSWDRIIKYGKKAIRNRLEGSLSRMGPMDLSDVGYDAFLSNGKQESYLKAEQGETVRIRLINAGTSTYFNVEFAGSPMTIVAADGVDIEPIQVKRLRIAIAETYDVIVPIQKNKSYEFRATSEDGTGKASTFIGNGSKVLAPDILKPNLFLMNKHNNHKSIKNNPKKQLLLMKHNNNHKTKNDGDMKNNHIINYMTDYQYLRASKDSSFDKPSREIILNLTGNMERYTWSFNNKTLIESDKILIKKGEIIKLILNNKTMMHHPLHLHGHFFRVLNKQNDRSPLKHTVNIPSMDKVIIEFNANKEKDWFFHCHNLYHMKAGMARVISYKNSTKVTPQIFSKLMNDSWYHSTDVYTLSNMTMGIIKISNTRNYIGTEYDYNYKKKYETEIIYARNITRYFDIYAGANFERENKSVKAENTLILGVKYVLPFLIKSNLRVNSKFKLRLSLESDIQLTKRNNFSWLYNTDKEYRFNISYTINKKLLLAATYDSNFKWGAGLRFKF